MPESTVLVADDDQAIRVVVTQALNRSGYAVRATSNAATLWKWVEDGEGDLVITDVVLPDENGLDLLPRIRKLRPDLRIVVMSAQNTLLTAVKAAQRGAFEYLPKPFDLGELVAVVKKALSKPAGRIERRDAGSSEEEQLPLIGSSPAMQEIYRTAARRVVRRHQHGGDPQGADRERALRPRTRRLHRSDPAPYRTVRAGRGRHVVPR
jgi:two-component system nitrogen regulation response regulator GlnG